MALKIVLEAESCVALKIVLEAGRKELCGLENCIGSIKERVVWP